MCCKLLQTLILFDFLHCIEMSCIFPLKSKDFVTSNEFMLTHARYLMYILVHNKLKKSKLISINFLTIETDVLSFCNNRFLIKEVFSEIILYIII